MKKSRSMDEELYVGYLLGSCSEEEKVRLEERFFKDEATYEQLLATEAELIDDFLRGELAPADRLLFERQYSSPARRERVAFGRTFQVFIQGASAPLVPQSSQIAGARKWRAPQSWFRLSSRALAFSLAAAVLGFGLSAIWLIRHAEYLRSSLSSLQAEHETLTQESERLERKLADLESRNRNLDEALRREQGHGQPPPARPVVSLFVLTPGLVRGTDEPVRLVLPKKTEQIRLQLDLDSGGAYRSYRAELRTAGGNLLWSQDMLKARATDWGKAVELTLPVEVVVSGEHELALRGLLAPGEFEDVGYYYFAILRR